MKRVSGVAGVVLALFLTGVQASENFPVELRGEWLVAAKQGDAEAQFKLGKSYCCGYGASYNTSKALYWMCRAGKQGHIDAIYEVARQLEATTDTGLPFTGQHFILEAYVWYRQAVDLGGHSLADLYSKKLARSFSAGQMKIIEARQSAWSESGCDQYTG